MPQDRFEEIFKQRLGEAEVAPSSGLWEKIQGELPPPTPFYRRSSFIAACLGAFLLVSGSLGYFVTNYDIKIVAEKDNTLVSAKTIATKAVSEPSSEYRFARAEGSFAERAKRNYGSFVAKSLEVLEEAKTVFSVNTKRAAEASVTSSDLLNANAVSTNNLESVAVAIPENVVSNLSYDQESGSENLFASNEQLAVSDMAPNLLDAKGTFIESAQGHLVEVVKPIYKQLEKERGGLHIGGFYGYNNTWIISKNFGQKDLRSNDVNYDVDFGGNYGVALGYDFNKRWGIQTEWVINAAYRQNYTYYWEGSRHIADIKLNYFQFPLLLKYHTEKENGSLSYLMGVRIARLKSAGLEVNTPSVRVVDLLNTNELGAIVGMEYAHQLNRHYSVSLSARGSVGRAYNTWSDLSEPGKPYNIAFGLRAGLHYNFVK